MKIISAVCSALDSIYKLFFYLCGIMLMALLAISCLVVFARLFNISPIWSDEVQRFLMIAMVFVAIPYMASSKSFLVVDLSAICFGEKIQFQQNMRLIGDIILLALLIYMCFPSFTLALRNTRTFSTALRLPMVYMYGFIPASFAFSAVAVFKNIVRHFAVERRAAVIEEAK